jgi:hypothetical protein
MHGGIYNISIGTPERMRSLMRPRHYKQQTQWPEFASKLYQPSDCRLSAKLVPTFADKGCRMVSTTDPYGRNLGLLDQSRYFFFLVAPQLYSRG